MYRHAQEEWLNNECKLIEKDKTKEPGKQHHQINNTMGIKTN